MREREGKLEDALRFKGIVPASALRTRLSSCRQLGQVRGKPGSGQGLLQHGDRSDGFGSCQGRWIGIRRHEDGFDAVTRSNLERRGDPINGA